MSRIRYDPETGEKIFPDLTKRVSDKAVKVFKILWDDDKVSFIQGKSIADATHRAGYTKSEVDSIVSWEVGDDIQDMSWEIKNENSNN